MPWPASASRASISRRRAANLPFPPISACSPRATLRPKNGRTGALAIFAERIAPEEPHLAMPIILPSAPRGANDEMHGQRQGGTGRRHFMQLKNTR